MIWLNLNSIEGVNALYEVWRDRHAKIVSPPEAKPWKLHEFTAVDRDGDFFGVFYDSSRDA